MNAPATISSMPAILEAMAASLYNELRHLPFRVVEQRGYEIGSLHIADSHGHESGGI